MRPDMKAFLFVKFDPAAFIVPCTLRNQIKSLSHIVNACMQHYSPLVYIRMCAKQACRFSPHNTERK